MKNIFTILQEERDRILEMHENATKNQYLNEQVLPVAPSPYSQFAQIPDLSKQPVPKSNKVSSYTTQKWNQFKRFDMVSITRGISAGAKFEATSNPLVVRANNVNAFYATGTGNDWTKFGKPMSVSFYCEQGKFYFTGEKQGYVSEQLSKPLVKYVCGYKPQTKIEAPGSAKTENPKTDQVTDKQNLSQQTGTNVVDLNKQIQQSLGIQNPTGKISDADVDAIIAKLG